MRLNIYLILTVLGCSIVGQAQDLSLKQTNRLFQKQAYYEAVKNYENQKPTTEVLKKLGDSYYYTGDMAKAAFTYSKIEDNGDAIEDFDRIYRYAQSLMAIEDYDKADNYMLYYQGQSWNTKKFLKELELTTPHVFSVRPMSNSGSSSDFGMTFMNADKVVFASSRNTNRPIYAWNGLPYLDLYQAKLDQDGSLKSIEPFNQINTDLHESNAVFNETGTVMYFNRNNEQRVKVDGVPISNMHLYRADLVDGQWSNIQSLPFNDETYSNQHPSLSRDGSTLYFSSNKPGGYGEFDIYKVSINPDGSYGEPENLGDVINTQHLDQFPYISDTNTLYYATNGMPGLGGLDIHRTDMVNGAFEEPINLGQSINSSRDDFAYIVDEQNDKAYFSSNRSGIDVLYASYREENMLDKYAVGGVVKDSITNKLLPESLVSLLDESGTVIDDAIVGDDATYFFKIRPNRRYTVRGTRKLYIPQNINFSTDQNGKISHDIKLSLLSYDDAEEMIKPDRKGDVQVELDQIFFDFDQSTIKPQAASTLDNLVMIMNKYPEMEIEISSHTDVRGPADYNLDLSNRRAAATLEYIVSKGIDRNRLRSIGYGEMQPLNKCVNEGLCTEEEYRKNRRSEFKILN
ncbi:Outer membrane protein OmpA [Nonlabens sp. Hel1_33_55]|uniref:OmpA family protein n=1 Tax=Nonlabens sp. Hel1_33_55 TaxID=1336802 RepID=UPI000875C664|nr:OmpA family protein [Nonlabens sp. Hel1_33_55]SCY04646.1 Outer membrane protein OmpA [Nonlabens sp. Hel1_33_55]